MWNSFQYRQKKTTSSQSGRPNLRTALELASSHFTGLVELGIVKVFVDYKIFDLIPDERDISFSKLAAESDGEEALLERFSSYLIAAEILTSPKPRHVAHTACFRAYRTGEVPAGFIVHIYNFLLRSMAHWPEYFQRHGLAAPKEANCIPLGLATGHPDSGLYGILDAEPKLAELFNGAMSGSARIYSLKGVYDFGWMQNQDRSAIVDVGGGSGLAVRDIVHDNPPIPIAKCAVFDLPKVLAQTRRDLGEDLRSVQLIEGGILDAFPQAIQGASAYLFRRVLNDFPDSAVIEALQRTREAYAPDSRVLIIEELLHPNRSKFSVAQDIFVMNFGGKRRSEAMFRELADQTGFRVNASFMDTTTDFGVIELMPVMV